MDQPDKPNQRRSLLGSAREAAQTLLLAALIYLGVQALIPPYAVEGRSMAPNLHDGERLLVSRSVYAHFDANKLWNLLPGVDRAGQSIVYPFHPPQRGEIVVFHPPGEIDKPYIKRVIGLAGDEIAFARNRVLVNGEPLAEPYIDGAVTACRGGVNCRLTVPDGAVYLLGDNRRNSTDSRVFGPVPVDAIVGKAWLANWPLDEFGFIPDVEYGD